MRLDIENKASMEDVTERKVRSVIKSLRSYGPSSFAALVDGQGSYVQTAGGIITCALEWRDVGSGRHFRAYHDAPSGLRPDDTALMFGGGAIKLNADEWFTADVVADTFCAFLLAREWPAAVHWRDVTAMVAPG